MKLPTALPCQRISQLAAVLLRVGRPIAWCLSALALSAIIQARIDASQSSETEAHNIARAVGEDIGHTLQLYDLSLRAMIRALGDPRMTTLDPDLRQSLLFDGATHDERFGFMNALNEKGEVVADSASATPRSGNFGGRDYFRAQRDNSSDTVSIGKPFLTDPGQPATVPISRRITKQDGSFGGVAVGTMRLAYVSDLCARFQIGSGGTISLLRDDGVVLQRYPPVQGEIGHLLADMTLVKAPSRIVDGWEDPADHVSRRIVLQHIDGLPLTVAVGFTYPHFYASWWVEAILIVISAAGLLSLNALNRADADRTRQEMITGTRYIAMIGHETLGPLQAIVASAELIESNGDRAGNAEIIQQEAAHLKDVVTRLFDYGHIEGATPDLRGVDLRTLIDQRRVPVARAAERKGLGLGFHVDPEVPRWIRTDLGRLRIILSNLLDNAVKYTEHGSIMLRVSRAGDRLRFALADTGIGVPPEMRDRLAKPHDRLGRECGPSAGSGLGLYTAKHLAAHLGGELDYRENPGGGSIFTLSVKLIAADPPEQPAPGTAAALPKLNLLLADDSDTNRQPVAKLLRMAGHQVAEARTGPEAVRLAGANDFDAVLLDMCMPRMGGLEAARLIHALPGRRGRTPVIAVTGHVPDGERDQWSAAGILDYVPKPCRKGELLRAIGNVIGPVPHKPRFALPLSTNNGGSETCQIMDWGQFESIATNVGRDTVRGYLADLEQQIAATVRRTGELPILTSPEFRKLVHGTANDAAELGFIALSRKCRDMEGGLEATQDMIALSEPSLAVLHQILREPANAGTRPVNSD